MYSKANSGVGFQVLAVMLQGRICVVLLFLSAIVIINLDMGCSCLQQLLLKRTCRLGPGASRQRVFGLARVSDVRPSARCIFPTDFTVGGKYLLGLQLAKTHMLSRTCC